MRSRLLAVDLDSPHLRVVREYSPSWSVHEIESSHLQGLPGSPFDLVIINGRETKSETLALCAEIRAQSPCATAAFLVALEHSCADQAQSVLELPRTRCVIKAFDHEYLARTIEEMLPQTVRPNA